MIKRLAGCIREYKKPSLLSPLFITGEVIMECLIPFITAKMINLMGNGGDFKTVMLFGGLLLLVAFASLACGALSGNYSATAACGFAKNLRHDLYHNVQEFSFGNIDKFSTSSLVTRLTTDINNVQMAYMMIIRIVVRAPLMMIFSVTMAFALNAKAATVFVFIIPFLAFALFLIIRKAMPLFKKVFKKYDRLNNSIQENVKGMRVVKSFVREDYETKKFAAASEDVCADFTRAEKLVALNSPIM